MATRRKQTPKRDPAKKPGDRRFGVGLLSAGAAAIGIGATLLAVVLRRARPTPEGHPAPDLSPKAPAPAPETRAPEHFRPDPTAVPTAEEREALRPATGPAKGFAADRGTAFADPQDAA